MKRNNTEFKVLKNIQSSAKVFERLFWNTEEEGKQFIMFREKIIALGGYNRDLIL